jgi:hypothetical protein
MEDGMKYELNLKQGSPQINIQAEETDQWKGFTTGRTVIDGLLVCGSVYLRTGKEVNLKIRLEDKPDLQALVAQMLAAQAEYGEIEKRTVAIYLSSRGWGDFSPLEWCGDIARPDAEILAECRRLIETGHDVDSNPTDNEIVASIHAAREKLEAAPARKAAREAEEAEDIARKIASGYCFACETYCHGDCGHYSKDPQVMYGRHLREMAREANYGIND